MRGKSNKLEAYFQEYNDLLNRAVKNLDTAHYMELLERIEQKAGEELDDLEGDEEDGPNEDTITT